MTRLDRLLRPDTVAVVGGSWGRSVIEQLQRIGFKGDIWPIHPTHTEIAGLRCYENIESLPAAPDACFIGVNRHATLDVVGALASRGGGGAVCFASGFSEASAEDQHSAELQQELLNRAGHMPVIGPNCYGFINYLDRALLWPDLHGGQHVESGVAIVTQSSNIAISLTMQRRALPIAYVFTAGNQAQISIAELGMAALHDSRVTALGMHIEGFGDIRAFEELAQMAAAVGKSIVAIKAGRSQQSRQAMISHTNSLSGSDASSDALMQRLGVARVDSLPALLEALKLCHVYGRLNGNTIASMSCSGGEAGLMADAILNKPVQYQRLSDAKKQALREALGPMVALANPLDYHTYIWNRLPEMTATFSAMLTDGADLSFLVIDFPREDLAGGESWLVAIDALIAAKKQTGSPVAILASLPENMPDSIAKRLLDEGIPSMYGIEEAMDAVVAASSTGKLASTRKYVPVVIACEPVEREERRKHVQESSGVAESSLDASDPYDAKSAAVLTEYQSKQLLKKAGLSVPEAELINDRDTVVSAANNIGFPVVLKLTDEAHKTEHDGVALNLRDEGELLAAADRLLARSNGLLVESFSSDVVAELLVGIVRESSGVLMLTLGAGGVLTELLRDTRNLLLPVSLKEIEVALGELNIAAVLHGYRNKPCADLSFVVEEIKRLSDWATEHADELFEVEINPLLCLSDGAVVADALIRMKHGFNHDVVL
jgi:acyl-CoA synthetase (NDP forming)